MNPIHTLPPRLALSTFAAGLVALLAACGGGGGATETRVASVSSVTPDNAPSYDSPVTFSVAGANLDLGLSASAPGCSGPTVLTGGTATAVKVTCTPSRDGDITLNLSTTSGTVLKSTTFTVPKPQVRMTTSAGNLLIELEAAKAPITVKNFLGYVQDGFYVNTVFHRIISTFMAQGGGYSFSTNYALKPNTRAPIVLERTTTTGLSNTAKTIAMARTSAADSATSQFFINLVDNGFLNAQGSSDGNGYAVFGTVITTADINSDATLSALKAVPVANNGGGEVSLPLNPPLITAVSRIR